MARDDKKLSKDLNAAKDGDTPSLSKKIAYGALFLLLVPIILAVSLAVLALVIVAQFVLLPVRSLIKNFGSAEDRSKFNNSILSRLLLFDKKIPEPGYVNLTAKDIEVIAHEEAKGQVADLALEGSGDSLNKQSSEVDYASIPGSTLSQSMWQGESPSKASEQTK